MVWKAPCRFCPLLIDANQSGLGRMPDAFFRFVAWYAVGECVHVDEIRQLVKQQSQNGVLHLDQRVFVRRWTAHAEASEAIVVRKRFAKSLIICQRPRSSDLA